MIANSEKKIHWEWKSIDYVGPIKYGEPALPIIHKYGLSLMPDYGSPGRDVYEFTDGTTISIENGLIDSVMCQSNFFCQGTNLIGLSINEVRPLLGDEDTVDNDFEDHTCFQFDKYELMIWVNKETEKVDSVSCF
jgi:hypothetical protein